MITSDWRIGMIFAVLILLAGCSVSEEEALELGRIAYIDSIGQEALEPNVEKEFIQFYLPRGFEVKEEIEYNILLGHNNQLFNLFYQPTEPSTSKFHLKRDKQIAGQAIIYEVIDTNELLSYLIIDDLEEKEGQLHVIMAVGGVRITTVTTYPLLEESIHAMTSIVQSYRVNLE